LSVVEYEALLAELDNVIGSTPTLAANRAIPSPDPRLSTMTDAQLLAEALGEAVD
jgi:hypothetical protein